MYPEDYRYTTEHEWVRVEDDIAVLGVTDFAQKELGAAVFVELPQVGHVTVEIALELRTNFSNGCLHSLQTNS